VRLVLLGVRGSTPAPGAGFVRYGGHTSAVAVLGNEEDVPTLVLDAGTGLRELPALLGGGAFCGSIVLSHLHWDHVQGIPFCTAVDRQDATVDLHVPGHWAGAAAGAEAEQLLARSMSPPHFPIPPSGLHGSWRILPARGGVLRTPNGAEVTLREIAHKGGVTFGIRVELDGGSIAYLPDHALHGQAAVDPGTSALVQGVDLLLHDGQYTAAEQALAVSYGHATIEAVLRFADTADVGALVLTHHAPGRTDEELDELASRWDATSQGRPVTFAQQGSVVEIGSPRRPRSARAGEAALAGRGEP
jgi:ribonuclease BN (tRNA processing enzyme)